MTTNAPNTHRQSWSANAPNAAWSTSSPAASWGTSQTGHSAHTWSADQGSSGQSLVQKAKEHLPGGNSSHASQSTTDSSDSSLLEKAKQYLPGSNSSQYTKQGNAGPMQGATDNSGVSSLNMSTLLHLYLLTITYVHCVRGLICLTLRFVKGPACCDNWPLTYAVDVLIVIDIAFMPIHYLLGYGIVVHGV